MGCFRQSKHMQREWSNTSGRLPVDVIRRWRGCPFTTAGVRAPTRPCNRRTSEAGVSPRRPPWHGWFEFKMRIECSSFFGSQLAEVTAALSKCGCTRVDLIHRVIYWMCASWLAKLSLTQKTYVKGKTKRDRGCPPPQYRGFIAASQLSEQQHIKKRLAVKWQVFVWRAVMCQISQEGYAGMPQLKGKEWLNNVRWNYCACMKYIKLQGEQS